MDLCYKIVEAVRNELKLNKLEVRLSPVTSSTRIPLMANGTVDLECGSTTNNLERGKQVSFTITHFVTSNRFASKKAANLKTIDDLKGKTIVSVSGSTNIKQITQINADKTLGLHDSSRQRHGRGLPDGGIRARRRIRDGRHHPLQSRCLVEIAKRLCDFADALSVEPYGIMLRKDDPAFKKVVDAAMVAIYRSGEINNIYNKWFLRPIPPKNINLNVPISPALEKVFASPNRQRGSESLLVTT